ncbi:MAG: chromosome segregation protein SMC [Chlorobi bacterium]|nr:MAG: chromosome segregation protein SMC [Bacteroidota bacterium]KXK36219.1 MAG: Smc family protein [Chlorobi bacterium OLB6]MBE2265893.1 chromosome segregation protein SMC [Flavobacteriales bacterium]MBL1161918.1 chromosome segregation protein SMC [Chlorobiota bacterium]MBW7854461.1 chromosome segregation protein SMC [Candidatus Kapabacteria bacterium]MCL4277927.1 chromosome segregation protein SMC [Ignavibacteria bacterium]
MYLSKLEMVGFKSFGLKTELSFNDGVTAIVGPNGCGKTNIVDAIRWVLGEQKTSMLRADNMEQVIFNGSKARKPLGMAEVSLTIENNKQVLPTEYSQVVITRRLFRSGESQYLLNRTVCRLKDIVELFMDTGVGANAYSVIELKMIETILSDKADERRHLFEEAAGVTKYKVRRKEAQRKLEAAQRDIARVQDIVREVQKTVNSLGRQAEKARQHQEISGTLRQLEHDLFLYELFSLRSEHAVVTASLEQLLGRQQESALSLTNSEAALMEAETRHGAAEESARQAMQREGDLKTYHGTISGELSVCRERITAAERSVARLAREHDESTGEQSTTSEQLHHVLSQAAAAEGQLRDARNQKDEKQNIVDSALYTVQEARRAVAEIRAREQNLQRETGAAKREHDVLKVRYENSSRRRHELRAMAERHHARIAEITAVASEQGRLLPDLQHALEAAEKQLKQAHSRRDELQTKQDEIQVSLDTLRADKAHTQASLEFLVGLVDTAESSGFLLKTQEWKPSTDKITLAEALNTADEHRVAIEAALGDAARYFVVSSRPEADQAIEALLRNKVGKATFLCRDSIPVVPQPPTITSEHGVVGWASELVIADDQLRSAVRGILGSTLITSTISAAWEAIRNGVADRVVTLSGEVVHKVGAVRGGSTTQTEGVRVGRRERIEQLGKRIETLDQQIADATGLAATYRSEYASINLAELSEIVRQATVSRNAVQQKIDAYSAQLAELESAAQGYGQEAASLQDDMVTLEQNIAHTVQILASHDEQITALASELSAADEQVLRAESLHAECILAARQADIEVVRLEGELQSLHSEQRRLTDYKLTISQRNEHRSREKEQLIATIAALNAELQTKEAEAEKIAAQVADVVAGRVQIEKELQESSQTVLRCNEIVRDQRKISDSIIRDIHEVELKKNTLEQHIALLTEPAETTPESGAQLVVHGDGRSAEIPENGAGSDAEGTGPAGDETGMLHQPVSDNGVVDEMDVEKSETSTGEEVSQEWYDSFNKEETVQQSQELRKKLTMMGNVNFLALEEHQRENERLQFMSAQLQDLLESEKTLLQTILEINQTARELFVSTFDRIRANFGDLFKLLFSEDDEADLTMVETEDNDPLDSRIEIIAKPRGKRPHSIEMLSGGEKTLTAIALLFSIYLVKPSPFCILDEVDAPLDDANIDRYLKIIRKFSENTQFLMITHNKRTMEAADTLYGVTMEEPAVSKVVSVQINSNKQPVAV